MCDMTHSYVWHDSIICVTWLIHMCDMTHSYVWHGKFTCQIHVWHGSFTCVTWQIHVWHGSFTCATCQIHVWHGSFTYVTRLICTRDMAHSNARELLHRHLRCLVHRCGTTHSYVWHVYRSYFMYISLFSWLCVFCIGLFYVYTSRVKVSFQKRPILSCIPLLCIYIYIDLF